MKKLFYLTIFAVCLSGCSSPASNDANTRTNVDISELNNPKNMNIQVDPNANTGPATNRMTDFNGKEIAVNKSAANESVKPPVPNAKPVVVPAPDNSEVTSSMNDKGQMLEVRTFKNNPTLAKIERLYVELDKPVTIAYLKDGKKVDITTVKIDDPMKSSAEDIVNIINAASQKPVKQP